jgi:hypothetical protein
MDWIRGKSTGMHGFYPHFSPIIGVSCTFSQKPIKKDLNFGIDFKYMDDHGCSLTIIW